MNSQQLRFLLERFVPRIMQCSVQMYFATAWMVWPPQKMTFSIYIFHVKPKWNIVYEYLKTKIFSRDSNILSQMHWTPNIFGHSATIIGGFGLSLKYTILNFKKMSDMPKKCLDAALTVMQHNRQPIQN